MQTQDIDMQTREDEIDAINQVVATVEHATQNELVEELLDLFRADAIRDDVAAVKVRQIYESNDGQPSESEGEGSPLFVMAKEDEQWRLVACQNTGVLDS